VHWACAALAGVLLLANLVWTRPVTTGEELAWVPVALGTFIGEMFIAAVLTTVTYLIARRSSLAANIVFGIVMGLGLAGTVKGGLVRARAQDSQQAFKEYQRLLNDVRIHDGGKSTSEQRTALLEYVERNAQRLPPGQRGAAMATAESTTLTGDAGDEYEQGLAAFRGSGGFPLTGLDSTAAIQKRLEAIDAALAANARCRERIAAMTEPCTAFLRAHHVSAADVAVLARQLKTVNIDPQMEIRDLEEQVFTAAKGRLEILRDRWGGWRLEAGGKVIFEPAPGQETLDRYNALTRQMVAASKREQEVIAQLAGKKNPP
jgi:hypothetical protein